MDGIEHAFKDMHFQQFNHNMNEEYWKFMKDPICDSCNEGIIELKNIGLTNIEENYLHEHS